MIAINGVVVPGWLLTLILAVLAVLLVLIGLGFARIHRIVVRAENEDGEK